MLHRIQFFLFQGIGIKIKNRYLDHPGLLPVRHDGGVDLQDFLGAPGGKEVGQVQVFQVFVGAQALKIHN